MFERIKSLWQLRNYAMSDAWAISTGIATYSTFTVAKAVKYGYKINPTVYRSVFLITKSAASVPWHVEKDNEPMPEHHLSQLFLRPNPRISRQDLFELVISWLELTGNGYMKKVKASNQTGELWPISPDRIAPKSSKNVEEWMEGYVLDQGKGIAFQPEDIVHLKFFNPANPLVGLGPLEAVSRTVDVDVDQQDWNKAAMKNRGVLDGIIALDRDFTDEAQADALTKKLNETMAGPKNARRLRALGSKAKYLRTAATPVEMDFSTSRRENRNEMYITFGVPPQYAGAQESATYNNYQVSELIFWGGTIIPLLDDIKDTLNFSFFDELAEGERITYDTSGIQAMLRAILGRMNVAKKMHEMGVPMSQLNTIFKLGVKEFDGWDTSHVKQSSDTAEGTPSETRSKKKRHSVETYEIRADPAKTAKKVSRIAEKDIMPEVLDLLETQQKMVFGELDGGGDQIAAAVKLADEDWIDLIRKVYVDVGYDFGKDITVELRSLNEIFGIELRQDIEAEFKEALDDEISILKEMTDIQDSTIKKLEKIHKQGGIEGWTVAQTQQAIVNTGLFASDRALRIARTITGAAASRGQFVSGKRTGASHKKWHTAGDANVRDTHQELNGDEVGIDQTFRNGARFPLDPLLGPGERVNCRCSMSFSMDEPYK